MNVILISGHTGSGKDAFANFLIGAIPQGQKTLIIHFGDPVKWMASSFFNWNGDKNTDQGRQTLQYVGTELMRKYNQNYWAEMIGEFLKAAEEQNLYDWVLIPDARFPNEIETIQSFFPEAITVRIERYNPDGSKYINPKLSTGLLAHASETSLDHYGFQYIIENRSNLNSLKDSAEILIEDLEEIFKYRAEEKEKNATKRTRT